MNGKNPCKCFTYRDYVVSPGLEPGQADSESTVLPLHHETRCVLFFLMKPLSTSTNCHQKKIRFNSWQKYKK